MPAPGRAIDSGSSGRLRWSPEVVIRPEEVVYLLSLSVFSGKPLLGLPRGRPGNLPDPENRAFRRLHPVPENPFSEQKKRRFFIALFSNLIGFGLPLGVILALFSLFFMFFPEPLPRAFLEGPGADLCSKV